MKKSYLIAGILLLLAAVLAFAAAMRSCGRETGLKSGLEDVQETQPQEETEEEEETIETETEEPYVSPIDFESLQETNSDIYAWLDIPGTDISYAVVQNAEDDTYYLDHAEDGSYAASGALFTESTYNTTTFDDPVTVIYGHHLRAGTYFGKLQEIYADEETFESCSEMVIYLPDRELHYQVSAAVPYDNRHILYNYDCTNTRMYSAFLSTIYDVRSIGAIFDADNEATTDDRVVVLSTCLQGDNTQRYLVLMKLIEIID